MASPSRLPHLQAYYSSRNAAATETSDGHAGSWSCQSLDKRLWCNNPGKAVEVRPVSDCWSFQPQPFRRTPHPYDVSRFYKAPDPKDCKTGGSAWFGYPQQRWKRHWLPKHEETVTVPEVTLDELRHLLTKKFGTLPAAFEHLDFVKNGRLSALEWSEGLFNLLFGTSGATRERPSDNPLQFQLSKIPRWLFNEQMKKLFFQMDVDKNGEIGYEEFAHGRGHPVEHPHEFSKRRSMASDIFSTMGAENAPTPVHYKESSESDSDDKTIENVVESGEQAASELTPEQQLVYDFSAFLLYKFPNVKLAFKAFDLNKNGTLSAMEFDDGARAIGYEGPIQQVFKLLDKDKSGQISVAEFCTLLRPSKRDIIEAGKVIRAKKKKKSKWDNTRIKPPGVMRRCLSLPDMDIKLPMGEHMASNAGFYAFERSPTRRLQLDVHPSELPGQDPFNYEDTRGPGTYDLPPETGATKHANKMACSKLGGSSMLDRCPRFMDPPTKEGKEDLKNLAKAYCSYDGAAAPPCGATANQLGAVINKVNKLGDTMGGDNMPGLMTPTTEISNILKMNRLDQELRAQGVKKY